MGITTNILSKSLGSLIKAGEPVSLKNISILKPIEPGLEKENFLKQLEQSIYSELDALN